VLDCKFSTTVGGLFPSRTSILCLSRIGISPFLPLLCQKVGYSRAARGGIHAVCRPIPSVAVQGLKTQTTPSSRQHPSTLSYADIRIRADARAQPLNIGCEQSGQRVPSKQQVKACGTSGHRGIVLDATGDLPTHSPFVLQHGTYSLTYQRTLHFDNPCDDITSVEVVNARVACCPCLEHTHAPGFCGAVFPTPRRRRSANVGLTGTHA
jgi:hypothetical protein